MYTVYIKPTPLFHHPVPSIFKQVPEMSIPLSINLVSLSQLLRPGSCHEALDP